MNDMIFNVGPKNAHDEPSCKFCTKQTYANPLTNIKEYQYQCSMFYFLNINITINNRVL